MQNLDLLKEQTKLRQLESEIRSKLKNRKVNLSVNSTSRKPHLFLSTVMQILFAVLLIGSLRQITVGDVTGAITLITFGLAVYFGSQMSKLQSLEGPSNRKEADIWLWENGRKLFVYSVLFNTLCAAGKTFVGLFYASSSYASRLLIALEVITWLGGMVFIISVWVILRNPELFLSHLIDGIGTGGITVTIVSLGVSIIVHTFYLQDVTQFRTFYILICIWGAAIIWRAIEQIQHPSTSSPVKQAVLQIIRPERLHEALKKNRTLIGDKIDATRIVEDLKNEGRNGVIIAMSEIVSQRYERRSKWVWAILSGLIISLIGFIIGAVGEALIQDLVYDAYFKPVVCQFMNILCD